MDSMDVHVTYLTDVTLKEKWAYYPEFKPQMCLMPETSSDNDNGHLVNKRGNFIRSFSINEIRSATAGSIHQSTEWI